MALDPDSVIEVRIESDCNSQRCFNIFHLGVYSGSTAGQTPTEWQVSIRDWYVAGLAVAGKLLNAMLDCMSNEASLTSVAAQVIHPVRYRASKVAIIAGDGTIVGSLTNQNTAAVFTKYGELAGQDAVGSWHQGGTPPNMFTNGSLSVGGLTAMATLAEAFLEKPSFVVGGDNVTFYPAILNKEPIPDTDPVRYQIKGLTEVIQTEVQQTARVMRRRTKGVGI